MRLNGPRRRPIRTAVPVFVCVFIVASGGCGGGSSSDGSPAPDPFAAQPDTSEGLANVSQDLVEVLEGGALRGACEAYEAARAQGTATRRARLLCGKEMFFYEGFGTLGVPTALVDFAMAAFPEFGPGARAAGMIEDPTSPERYPLGFGEGSAIAGAVPTLAFTCASCHFARLPDGRYAVGAANHDFDYGFLNLALAVFPTIVLTGPEGHDPDAMAELAPLVERFDADVAVRLAFLRAVLGLVPALGTIPAITPEIEGALARWKPGTQDFLMAPAVVDDGVHTISKIQPLWGVPDAADLARYGMESALLGFTGVTHSLESFLAAFVRFGGGDVGAWPAERLAPLAEYVYSLRAPENPNPPAVERVAQGRRLFASKGCLACHGGARGGSKRFYTYEEIGTEDAMKRWMDADLDGTPCCGLDLGPDEFITHGIKAPRLTGLWAQGRFLHNGSVDSLDNLFCRNASRPTIPDGPFSDRGHRFTCDGLTDAEKDALVAYLRTL